MSNVLPLVVDLDGTLTPLDSTRVQLSEALLKHPILGLRALVLFIRGQRAAAKVLLGKHIPPIDYTVAPANHSVLEYIQARQKAGAEIILCTGANQESANAANEAFGPFDNVFATSRSLNLTSKNKAAFLKNEFRDSGFEYIGDSKSDRSVYEAASKHKDVGRDFSSVRDVNFFWRLSPVLRMRHWTKNLVILLPLVLEPAAMSGAGLVNLIVFATLFSLVASGGYIFNDVHDFRNDISHPEKAGRPFVSGSFDPLTGLLLGFGLIVFGVLGVLGLFGLKVASVTLVYIICSLAYTNLLKKFTPLDVIALAMFYVIRVQAGLFVANLELSNWLLNFVFLVFLSLALAKRYADVSANGPEKSNRGRGYGSVDAPVTLVAGLGSGLAATTIFTLYLWEEQSTPEDLWIPFGTTVIIVSWLLHLWFSAIRGQVMSDPINWAIKDRVSWLLGLAFVVAFSWMRLF